MKRLMFIMLSVSICTFILNAQEATNPQKAIIVVPGGDVGIGTEQPKGKLDVDGNIYAQVDGKSKDIIEFLNPIGTVQAYAGPTDPKGWLICDGRELNPTDPKYKDLFALIGTTFGGNGYTTFRIPDLRGQFVRGLDNAGTARGAAGVDPDEDERTLGSKQSDALQSHKHIDAGHSHIFQERQNYESGSILNNDCSYSGGLEAKNTSTSSANLGDPVASTQGPVEHGPETRPVNVALNFIIKY